MNTINTIAHFFVPRHSNNQKAKMLHSSSLVFLIAVLVGYQIVLQFVPISGVKILGYAANISTTDIVNLTNQKRQSIGLGSLSQNSLLNQAAMAKAHDMFAKGYWAHVSPDGTQPWTFITNANYRYKYAGENLARDFSNASSAVEAWMASPSHRDNMLSGKYNEIGVAVLDGNLDGVETTIIVQLFGTRYVGTASAPVAVNTNTNTNSNAPVVVSNIVPTLVPTKTPKTPTPTTSSTQLVASATKIDDRAFLFSPFSSTKTLSLAVVSLLLFSLIVDGVISSRRKSPRIAGKTFAHFAFLGMILVVVLIARAGIVL